MSTPQLMEVFGFDADDLEANRADHLTYAQRERVAATYRQYRRGIMPTVGIIGAIMVSAAVISQVRGFVFHELALDLSVWLYLFVILVLIVGVWSYWLTAEGVARLKTGLHGGYTPYYHAKIGRHTFYLTSAEQFHAFREGVDYDVYYVAYWPDVILSVEEVDRA